jgi:hypothetical protein
MECDHAAHRRWRLGCDSAAAYDAVMSSVLELANEYWAFYRRTAQLWNIDRGDVDEIERWEDLSCRRLGRPGRGLACRGVVQRSVHGGGVAMAA